jgi:diaminohydroxyphosphoribosylaminopyrimidine deaminase/5-amino-6-(5-phosphoribosylamino)uracil reductase
MRRALRLTERAWTHPNPCVGAVVVRDEQIIGEGWTTGWKGLHAEPMALQAAGEAARGATLYVTLEPCAHRVDSAGAPRVPCAIHCVQAGIARVVAALTDPDPRTSGRGFALLRESGIAVVVGEEAHRAREAHRAFLKHRTTGLPWVLHKAAMTLDGKLAAPGGDSHWITGAAARRAVHRLRHRADALVVGVGTILADDPLLTTRLDSGNGHDPIRVIVDSRLRTPSTARVARTGTVFLGTDGADATELRATGAEVHLLPAGQDGRVDIVAAARWLAGRGFLSVLLESGGRLAAAFWAAQLVDRALFFVAPKLIGGAAAPTPIDGDGLSDRMAQAQCLTGLRVRRYGEDIALEGNVHVHGNR